MSADASGLYLVISNIAVIPAFGYALSLWLLPEAMLLGIVGVISFLYHMCQSGFWCLAKSDCRDKDDFAVMQMTDEFFVFVALVWFIMYFFEIRMMYRITATFLIQAVIFIPIIIKFNIVIFEGAIIALLIILSIIVLMEMPAKSVSFYIFSTIVAIVLISAGFTLFVIAGDPGDNLYVWLHGTWHILLFVAAFFVIDLKYGITDDAVASSSKATLKNHPL